MIVFSYASKFQIFSMILNKNKVTRAILKEKTHKSYLTINLIFV